MLRPRESQEPTGVRLGVPLDPPRRYVSPEGGVLAVSSLMTAPRRSVPHRGGCVSFVPHVRTDAFRG